VAGIIRQALHGGGAAQRAADPEDSFSGRARQMLLKESQGWRLTQETRVGYRVEGYMTGARAKAWCLLIHAEASLSHSLKDI